jgi:hypothetical protein
MTRKIQIYTDFKKIIFLSVQIRFIRVIRVPFKFKIFLVNFPAQ